MALRELILKVSAPILLTIMVYVGTRSCLDSLNNSDDFAPLSLSRLDVSPSVLAPGDTVTLLDGVCNNTGAPVAAQLYLGAQSEGSSTFSTITIDLLRKRDANGNVIPVTDTSEGRVSQVFEPGCTITEPLTAVVPASMPAGLTWRLKAHIIVTGPQGQMQNIIKTSNKFQVVEP